MFTAKKASFVSRTKASFIKRRFIIIFSLLVLIPLTSCISATRGNYYYKRQNYEQAIKEYTYVLEQNPKNFKANEGMGDIHFERKEFEQARLYYDKAAEARPTDTELVKKRAKLNQIFEGINELIIEGNELFSEKSFVEAEAKYKEIIGIYPDDQQAITKSTECRKIINDASLNFSEGANAERDGDYKVAFEKYKKAYELTPENDIYKDKMESAKGELDKAREFIALQVETIKEENYEDAISSLESKSGKTSKSDEIDYYLALAYAKVALNQKDDNETLRNMYNALNRIKDLNSESQFYSQASELKKKIEEAIDSTEYKVETLMKKANDYYLDKDYDQALKAYTAIIKDYSESKFVKECRKREVICIIEEIMTMEYNPLPELEVADTGKVFKSVIIEITNKTSFKLQFFYLGKDFGKVDIEPGAVVDLEFQPSHYKMAAKLFANKLYLYARENELLKGKYSLLFYEQR
jgi:tetratricopeptide (TPR) repeat protein